MNAFTFELARRLAGTGVTANCLHPGAVATNIWHSAAVCRCIFKLLIGMVKPFMLNSRKARGCRCISRLLRRWRKSQENIS